MTCVIYDDFISTLKGRSPIINLCYKFYTRTYHHIFSNNYRYFLIIFIRGLKIVKFRVLQSLIFSSRKMKSFLWCLHYIICRVFCLCGRYRNFFCTVWIKNNKKNTSYSKNHGDLKGNSKLTNDMKSTKWKYNISLKH